MRHPLDDWLRDAYRLDEVRALARHLIGQGTFEFPTLPTGLYSSAAFDSSDLDYTGYRHVWLRDNVHIAHHFHVLGQHERAARAVAAATKFLHSQRRKLRDIIGGRADPQSVMLRPHVRFDGVELAELPERWAHAQNDAIGYWMWLAVTLAREGHWLPEPQDFELLADFVEYLAAIGFWQDEDSGHWEETRKVEASSIGAVLAGLVALRDYFAASVSGATPLDAAETLIGETRRRTESLIERGHDALHGILPAECVQDDVTKNRRYDSALLFLIYPLRVVTDEMADRIVDDVVKNLLGTHGVKRYLGDSYWCADYKLMLAPEERSVDFSNDLTRRDRFLVPGGEAQWCVFDPIISIVHGLRFQATGAPERLALQTKHLNRGLRQLTGDGERFPPLRCPESYYRENGTWVPNDITPLLWTQANLRLAMRFMEQSLSRREGPVS